MIFALDLLTYASKMWPARASAICGITDSELRDSCKKLSEFKLPILLRHLDLQACIRPACPTFLQEHTEGNFATWSSRLR